MFSKWKEILLGVVNALVILAIVFVLGVALGNPRGFRPFVFFGPRLYSRFYSTLVVLSGSMEPVLKPGDLAVFAPPRELKPGMIAAFQLRDGRIVTHRIVRLTEEGYIITQGDANNTEDRWFGDDGREYYLLSVSGIYSGIRVPWIGRLTGIFRRSGGTVRSGTNALGAFTEEQSVSGDFQAGYWVPTPTP